MVKVKKARPPRIGRPPVADADRRETLVRVLTTEAEHGELQQRAHDRVFTKEQHTVCVLNDRLHGLRLVALLLQSS